MSKKIETIPVETWQFYNTCKQRLGISTLTKMFKISLRQAERWGCDPDFTVSSQRNPMDRYETLLKKLMDHGVEDIATAAVDRQARIVGCLLRKKCVNPDKETITEELLDNLPAMAEYQEAARSEQTPMEVIREKARKFIKEIEEDVALLEQLRG